MTVRELITALERMSPNDQVVARDESGDLVIVDNAEALTLRVGKWVQEPVVYVSGS